MKSIIKALNFLKHNEWASRDEAETSPTNDCLLKVKAENCFVMDKTKLKLLNQ